MTGDARDWELTFDVDGLTDQAYQALSGEFDAMAGVGHGGGEFVTLAVPATTAVNAARRAVARLLAAGMTVRRLREELVTRADIAERAEVTRQAVGNWIRAERRAGEGFPEPFHPVAGGVYLWGEVNAWLRGHGQKFDDWDYPSREDHIEINADLHNWLPIKSDAFTVPVSITRAPVVLVVDTHVLLDIAFGRGTEMTWTWGNVSSQRDAGEVARVQRGLWQALNSTGPRHLTGRHEHAEMYESVDEERTGR